MPRKRKEDTIFKNIWDPVWSDHRIGVMTSCPRKYYYQYLHPDVIETIPYPDMVFGQVIHKTLQKFYKKDGAPKYKNKNTFTSAAVGDWKRRVKAPIEEGGFGPVNWKNEAEPYAVWAHLMKELAPIIYDLYESLEPPIFAEFKFPTLKKGGLKFGGIADRIGPHKFSMDSDNLVMDYVIGDYKSRKREVDEFSLKTNRQFTMYAMLFNYLCRANTKFARKAKVSEDDIKKLMEDELHIYKKVIPEHHWIETGYLQEERSRLVKIIQAPKREPHHLSSLIQSTKKLQDELQTCLLEPRPEEFKCKMCPFNKKCDEDYGKDHEVVIPEHFAHIGKMPKENKEIKHKQLKLKLKKGKKDKPNENQLELF